uniref:Uncharacterized protein n=1 Tax=Setaria digitata TaxID=48799 RepID=A0A915Q5B3_9BILA
MKKRQITLPNGTVITLSYGSGKHSSSITSAQFNAFEPLPTILEETEIDIESRASSRELCEIRPRNQLTS